MLVLVAAVQQDEPQPQQQQEQAARHQEQDQLPDKNINTLLLKYIKIDINNFARWIFICHHVL